MTSTSSVFFINQVLSKKTLWFKCILLLVAFVSRKWIFNNNTLRELPNLLWSVGSNQKNSKGRHQIWDLLALHKFNREHWASFSQALHQREVAKKRVPLRNVFYQLECRTKIYYIGFALLHDEVNKSTNFWACSKEISCTWSILHSYRHYLHSNFSLFTFSLASDPYKKRKT